MSFQQVKCTYIDGEPRISAPEQHSQISPLAKVLRKISPAGSRRSYANDDGILVVLVLARAHKVVDVFGRLGQFSINK